MAALQGLRSRLASASRELRSLGCCPSQISSSHCDLELLCVRPVSAHRTQIDLELRRLRWLAPRCYRRRDSPRGARRSTRASENSIRTKYVPRRLRARCAFTLAVEVERVSVNAGFSISFEAVRAVVFRARTVRISSDLTASAELMSQQSPSPPLCRHKFRPSG